MGLILLWFSVSSVDGFVSGKQQGPSKVYRSKRIGVGAILAVGQPQGAARKQQRVWQAHGTQQSATGWTPSQAISNTGIVVAWQANHTLHSQSSSDSPKALEPQAYHVHRFHKPHLSCSALWHRRHTTSTRKQCRDDVVSVCDSGLGPRPSTLFQPFLQFQSLL